jgi:hypothetical protein
MECNCEGCLTGMTEYNKSKLFKRIRRKLGEPVMGVELLDEQIEECVCEAIEEYSSYINNWALENRMSQMLGLPKDIDFTLKFVSNNFGFEQTFSRAYSEIVGTAQNSTRELKRDSIILSAGTQDYFIPPGREVNEIIWYTPSFINLTGLDPFSYSNIAFTEFGASFAGYSLYYVMPVYDTLLTAQAMELRNKVRGSEYSYRLIGGPAGTKRLTLYPVPKNPQTAPGGVYGAYYGTPGVLYYFYYDTIGIGGNPAMSGFTANPGYTGGTGSQGNGLVSGPSDAKLYNLSFEELNDVAKTWVKKYAQALAKELLGIGIRGKFSGELPIPGAQLTMNSESLITNGRADMERLKEELKELLEKLNYKAILENNAAIQESVNKTLSYNAFGIYTG